MTKVISEARRHQHLRNLVIDRASYFWWAHGTPVTEEDMRDGWAVLHPADRKDILTAWRKRWHT